jgi:LytS/YehU family sensor histidine kinase
LTDFSVSGEKKVLRKALNDSDTITLSKGETNFQLSFSSTDFLNSDKTLFRYRLNNSNTDWIVTNSHNRSVNYSNLKPGCYLFEIQATNVNSEWTAVKKIVFNIKPYYYQTLLFRISVPLFIVFVLVGIIFVYIRQLKQKEKLKQDALKLQSLRGQMNPHFIFNSLNSINYFISNNDKLSANRYIADFSRLIRSILSNLGNDYIPFRSELDSIKDYLNIEHLRFGDKFDFELSADRSNGNSDFELFPGLVQPFIENAIWHGVRALDSRKGFIKVSFLSVESDRIRCYVEDDGIGCETSLKRKSDHENHNPRGINIVNERLQLISKLKGVNYHLEISELYPDRKDKGTRVEIDIPVKIKDKVIK